MACLWMEMRLSKSVEKCRVCKGDLFVDDTVGAVEHLFLLHLLLSIK